MTYSTHADLFEEIKQGCGQVRKNQITTFLYEKYLRLACSTARRYYNSLTFDEAMSSCQMGLLKAIEKYDYTTGVDFAYFAQYYMRSECQKEYRNNRTIHIPANIISVIEKLKKAGVFTKDLNELTPIELSARNEYQEVYLLMTPQSNEIVIEEDEIGSVIDSIEQDCFEAPDDSTYMVELNKTLERLIDRLPETERTLIIHTIGFNGADTLGCRELGKLIGKSYQTAINRYNKALSMLKDLMLEEKDIFDNIGVGK